MAKVRFLQSVYVVSLNKVATYNDEFDINDEKVVENLVKEGLVDVLIEEKNTPKTAKKATSKGQK